MVKSERIDREKKFQANKIKFAKYHDIYSGLSYAFWDGFRNQNSRKYWLNPARDPVQTGLQVRENKS